MLRPIPREAVRWDGRKLVVAATGDACALDLDGCHFATAEPDRNGNTTFELPFSPSGNALASARLRRGRDGPVLDADPFALRFGVPGTITAEAPVLPLAPLAGSPIPAAFAGDCLRIEVVVIVPVYGAPALVERCIESVLRHSGAHARLIVIDDASPDPAIAPLLSRYRGRSGVELLHNETNRGFTATVNRGIACAARADVVLLNADTEVGPNWLAGLRRAAYSASDIGTVTAVSDNAGAFSVPELEQYCPWPAAWSFTQASRALWQHAGLAYPRMPTGNGFCLYIRRAALDAVGAFDEQAFAEGYGEENDFCQRAQAAGFRDLIAGNVFVAHARSQSFGVARRVALGETGMRILRARWPNYDADVARDLHSFERRVLDWRVRRVYAAADSMPPPRPRVAWIGVEPPADPAIEAWRVERAGTDAIFTHATLARRSPATDFSRALRAGLQELAIELVVCDYAMRGEVAPVAAELGIVCVPPAGSGERVPVGDLLAQAGRLR
jgi:GT2 family glycosyltransferase